ncbi:MAG: PfkB family carbohydrate kinase, partial [Chloroflexota bacterium]
GTVTNNLRALGVTAIYAAGVTGDDGEGYELRRRLAERDVDVTCLVASPEVVTGTYLKPTVLAPDGTERELGRMDIKNRRPLPAALEDAVIMHLRRLADPSAELVDAVIVADQVEERNHGAITDRVRHAVCDLAAGRPDLVWLADSRRRIGEYRHLMLKPNRDECLRAIPAPGGAAERVFGEGGREAGRDHVAGGACALASRTGRPVFVTLATEGMLVVEPDGRTTHVPAVRVEGPVDPTGAGDSATAGIVPALALGASPVEAAALGTLVASVTVRQLGATGAATPQDVLAAHEGT